MFGFGLPFSLSFHIFIIVVAVVDAGHIRLRWRSRLYKAKVEPSALGRCMMAANRDGNQNQLTTKEKPLCLYAKTLYF